MLHPEHGEPNLLKTLKDNGYYVWWGGKNDLVPAQHGYEPYCHIKHAPTPLDCARWGHTPRRMFGSDRGQAWRGSPDSDTYYSFFVGRLDTESDTLFCDQDWQHVLGAIDLIRSYDGQQPLCIYLPLTYPHPEYAVEDPWFSLINRTRLPPRIPAPADWSGKPALLQAVHRLQNMHTWTEDRWNQLRATYYGMCARVDHQLGLILQALRDADLYNDTALFCFSDHGDFTGDYGLVEKTQNTFEDCLTRVPFIIKPPAGVPVHPGVRDALVELIDMPATVEELAGIQPAHTHFGRSLLPLITDPSITHRDAVFCEGGRLNGESHAAEQASNSFNNPEGLYWPRMTAQQSIPEHGKAVMCRTQTHKYVYRLYEKHELYDLQADPAELHNRIDDPALAHVAESLRNRTLQFMVETADVVPQTPDRRG